MLSLDVFDTLLIRLTDPDVVIDATCRWLAERTDTDLMTVQAARRRAGGLLSATAVSKGFDPETPAEHYFGTWVRMLVGDRIGNQAVELLAEEALSFELEAEKRCLSPNEAIIPLLDQAKQHGIPVVALSDMYLESSRIGLLLKHHGLSEYLSTVVSSADHALQKRTGRLFARGLAPGGFYDAVAAEDILHIGDDTQADGKMATAKGMQSILVYGLREMAARQRSFYMKRDYPELADMAVAGNPNVGGLRCSEKWVLALRSVRRLLIKSPMVQSVRWVFAG